MAGWPHQKRVAFEKAFRQFLMKCQINSKNNGVITLGDNLYVGQERFIKMVFDGLEQDKHRFWVLKSRQLGLTTISRALSVFYLGMHKGLGGALVFDTSSNKDNAREELTTMIADLPAALKFPGIKKDNREGLMLANSSKILFKSAGIRKSKASGTLGRSVGLSMAHLSELCSYDGAEEGLLSFERSLSDSNPDRLYIYESTARGYNMWFEKWTEARSDPEHNCCLFLGWWSHQGQQIARDSKDWQLYGLQPPTKEEAAKIAKVKDLYDFDVTQEQLAWYRRLVDPAARTEGESDAGFEASTLQKQEDPWDETEAFQQTGAVFFADEKLKDQTDKYASRKFDCWMFLPGNEFPDMAAIKAENSKSIELKVWEQPKPEAVYVMGIDPAFGENENNDRSSIQVLRCYADGCDQVAEYAYSMISTKHLAWVAAAVMAWYGNEPLSEVNYILELNGPGSAVLNELKSLKFQIEHGYAPLEEQGLKNIFRNVRQYLYARPDSLSGVSGNVHWKTTQQLKVMILEQLRGFVGNGMLRVRSHALIEEMKTIARDGDTIQAEGSMKDDRVLAMALAVHHWETRVRKNMIVQRRTREAEDAKRNKSVVDQVGMFNASMMQSMFRQKVSARIQAQRMAQHAAWRYGRR